MQPIVIYTKSTCGYCHAAKELLRRKNAAYTEVSVDADAASHSEMIARAQGRSTVPQIFIGARHVGGCDDLHALEHSGGLDALLADAAQ